MCQYMIKVCQNKWKEPSDLPFRGTLKALLVYDAGWMVRFQALFTKVASFRFFSHFFHFCFLVFGAFFISCSSLCAQSLKDSLGSKVVINSNKPCLWCLIAEEIRKWELNNYTHVIFIFKIVFIYLFILTIFWNWYDNCIQYIVKQYSESCSQPNMSSATF